GKLQGGFKPADNTDFTVKGWWDGSYQHQKDQYLNDEMGFRADLVRLNNQIDYSLFDKCHAGWTIKGKDCYMYQWPYTDAYYGNDYVGYQTVLDRSIKLKAIQDTLERLGKHLILVYMPSKASSYPEYIPVDRVKAQIGMTNYRAYRHVGDSLGIRQVDMDAWFVSMKHSSKEPLYSKQGIHFTMYGATLCGDSLVRYMEGITHIRVQHPDWSKMEHTDKIRGGDDDVSVELNLIFPVCKETLAYPIVKDIPDTATRKINAIYIGDSYTQKMVEFGIVHKMNGQCEFWSLFKELHDINHPKWSFMKDYDWKAAINTADCVVLAYTLFNFRDLGNGFIDQAYYHYYPMGVQAVK
ncbi:MAG: hypothetical protein WCG87_13010, partial [Bacteroidota bacterium]